MLIERSPATLVLCFWYELRVMIRCRSHHD